MNKPVALNPEDVQFTPGRVYYAKLRFSHKIEPMYCVAVGGDADRRSSVKKGKLTPDVDHWPLTYAIKDDIEYIIGGVSEDDLSRVNQERLFGRRRVASVEKERGESSAVSQPSVFQGREAD